MNSQDIEIAIANLFNPRKNLIIPRVSWGFAIHECDVLIVSVECNARSYELHLNHKCVSNCRAYAC